MDREAAEIRERARLLREGSDADCAEAAKLYETAVGMGDIQSASSLGYMLMVGEGIPKDETQAEKYLRMAADGGDPVAMCNLGVLLSDISWFENAAGLGSLRAMKNLAASYSTGSGAPLDKEKAAEYYRMASELGDIDSTIVLATMKRNGDGIPVDKAGAAELYRLAADAGDPDAQYDLAFMLDAGEGIPINRAEAEILFRKSAEQGDTDACLCLGGILYERKEFAEAEKWFMDAAMKGEVKASYNLGLMQMDGSMGEPDRTKAMEWFEMSAEEGFAYAQTMMGTLCLDSGKVKEAEKWFRKSAAQGEPTAMYNLGALGISGQIRMDDREAMDFLVKAASGGVMEAAELLSKLTAE